MFTPSCLDSNIKLLFHGSRATYHLRSNLSPNPCTAPTRNAKLFTWHNWYCPFNTSNPYFLLPVSSNCMNCFLRFRLRSHYQLRQADITGHLFLDYLDSAHIVPYLALGMNSILSLSVQSFNHSETRPFSTPIPL